MIEDVVCPPGVHRYALPLLAVMVVELPELMLIFPEGVVVAVGRAFTVMVVADEVAEQPLELVTRTV